MKESEYLRNLNTYKLKSILFKIFISYLSFLFIAFLSGTAMFRIISKLLIEKEAAINYQSLTYAIRIADDELTHVRDLMYSFLLNNKEILNNISQNDNDIYQQFRTVGILAKFKSMSRFIDECWIVNLELPISIGYEGTTKIDSLLNTICDSHGLTLSDAGELFTDEKSFHILPWIKLDSTKGVMKKQIDPMISLIAKDNLNRGGNNLLVRVKENDILNILIETNITKNGIVSIIDNNGTIVSSSEKSLTGTRLKRDIIDRFRGCNERYSLKQGENLVVFARSNFFDGYYYSEIPYCTILQSIAAIRSVFYIAMSILTFIYLFAAILYSKFFYSPIIGFIKKFNVSRKTSVKDDIRYKDEYTLINNIIENINNRNYQYEDTALLNEVLDIGYVDTKFIDHFPAKTFQVAVIRYPHESELIDTMQNFLCSQEDSVNKSRSRYHFIKSVREDCYLVVNADKPEPEAVRRRLLDMKLMMQKKYNISMVIGVGTVVTDPRQIRDSLQAAILAIDKGMCSDKDQVYESNTCLAGSFRIYFPVDFEAIASNAIVSGCPEYLFEIIDNIFEKNKELPNFYLKIICREFSNIYFRLATKHCIECHLENFEDRIEKEYRFEQIQDGIKVAYLHLFEGTKIMHGTAERIVASVIEYITKHYGDPNLSNDLISRSIGFSSSYVSILFKRNTGDSLSNYLLNYRFEKAKEMLSETNLSIKEISHFVGFRLENSFIRSFRCKYGVSPGEYRRLCYSKA